MGTVHEGQLLPVIILGDRLIGQQHKILDNPCGHISVIRLDVYRPSIFIQYHLRLRKIKINGSPLASPAPQDP